MTAVLHDQAAETRALVDAAKTGDRDAVGALYARYQTTIRLYIYRRVYSHPLAEDLTHDVFRRMLSNIHRYEHQGRDIGAWLITIARNAVADHYKSAVLRSFPVEAAVFFGEDPDSEPGPDARAVQAEKTAALRAAIARLNPVQRRCIELRFLRGLSVEETAAAMGKNEGAIKALQYRAIGALRRDEDLEALR